MVETQTLDSSQHSQEDIKGTEDQPMADVQNPKPTSDSNSESDSDSDDEDQEELRIQTLEAELSTYPTNYDAHVQYIKSLRKKGDIEKLRQAREAMNELFPLSPQMWQEWAKDETSLSSGPEAFAAIDRIYERGVFDYLSIPLWCDYLNFVQEYDPSVRECSPAGISKARNLFEHALTAAGLHVVEGSRIWEVYREFEQAIFYTISETDIESREKQVQRIRNIFHRQLSVPLGDLSSTLLTYKAWEAEQGNTLDVNSSSLEGVPPHVASAYQKALDALNARIHLEEQISRHDLPDAERIQQFLTYIKFEESFGDPARVQILYERAATEFPISSDIWLNYTRYLDKTLKTASIVRDSYARATRNCSWIGELWACYLLSLERGHSSEGEISAVFEKALQCNFTSFDEYLDIFLTRVDGLRRRISAGEMQDALDYAMIRETFQRAYDFLSPHLKNTDRLLRMHSYWAHLESNLGKDIVAARGVWESLLKICGSMLEAWQNYIAMEVEMGCTTEARSLYKRCYSKRFSGTGSEDICHSWVRFEREFGTLEDYDHAIQKVAPRLEELLSFRLQQESKNISALSSPKENLPKKNVREKRKSVSDMTDQESPAKRQKDTTQNLKKGFGKDKSQEKKSIEGNKVEDVRPEISQPDGANREEPKDLASGNVKQYTDQCTAFISNLSLQANYEDLRRFFSDVGGVTAVRILKDKFTGKSRGLAYVDFSDDAHLAAAVAKNKQKLLGKKLSIARSAPKQRKSRESVGRSSSPEHGKMMGQDAEQSGTVGRSNSAEHRHGEGVQLKGNIKFAAPRAVKALGWTSKSEPKSEGTVEDDKPKSNDEFRKMFLKS